MFIAVLHIFVIFFNVLDCRRANLINLSVTRKEADFIVKALNKSIQNVPREHGEDYQLTKTSTMTDCRDDSAFKTYCPQWKEEHGCSLERIPGWLGNDSISSLCPKTCDLCPDQRFRYYQS